MNSVTLVGRALVHVRQPHVERHGPELEGDRDDHEDETEDHAEAGGLVQP